MKFKDYVMLLSQWLAVTGKPLCLTVLVGILTLSSV